MINPQNVSIEITRHPYTFVSLRQATMDEWLNMGKGGPILPDMFSTPFDFQTQAVMRLQMRDYAGNEWIAFSPENNPFIQRLFECKPYYRFHLQGWRKVINIGEETKVLETGIAYFQLDLQCVQMIKEAGKMAPGPVKSLPAIDSANNCDSNKE